MGGSDSYRDFNSQWQRTRTMRTAQHLTKGEIERALAGLTGWPFLTGAVWVFALVGGTCLCATARMPRRMHKRTLLCDQQQGDT